MRPKIWDAVQGSNEGQYFLYDPSVTDAVMRPKIWDAVQGSNEGQYFLYDPSVTDAVMRPNKKTGVS